ncbi:MAG: hypothetical protein ACTSU7_09140, partial [Candidatus Heimdallarchaeaceae archaeon]
SNFNESKASMITMYEQLVKQQIDVHGSELKIFQDKFNENADEELVTFSKQSDEMKEETKTLITAEKSDIKSKLSEIQAMITEDTDKTKETTESEILQKITLLEGEIERLKTSINQTSSQIIVQLEDVEKDNLANIASQSSKIKSQIAETQQSIMADLDVEAKEHISRAEDAEKRKRDLITRIEKLERSIESIKSEL